MSIDKKALNECLNFVENYWEKITYQPKDTLGDPHIIPLPNSFVTINAKNQSHWNGSLFYWDSFFIFRGLIDTKRERIMPGMVDDFIYLFNKFGIVPTTNKWAFLDRSQPPFLSSMIFDAYFAIKRAKGLKNLIKRRYANQWLTKRIFAAQKEYFTVWEDADYYHHKVKDHGLSRYGDRDVGYGLTSELESGWDLTTRFYSRCNDFLPVDLNSYLHKYEKDFARFSRIVRHKHDETYWNNRASERHINMNKYMWNEKKGFFFDYDYRHKIQSECYSLAGFVPMWAKLASFSQAKEMVKKLSLFESPYGLTITAKESLPPKVSLKDVPAEFRVSIEELLKPKQWDYPNIWSPLEYLTVIGLLRYGFIDDAIRIMEKSIKANIKAFQKYGALLEKMDGLTGEMPKTFWYPSYLGFGWTNAVFYRYVKILEYIETNNGKIYGDQINHEPPYSLTGMLH